MTTRSKPPLPSTDAEASLSRAPDTDSVWVARNWYRLKARRDDRAKGLPVDRQIGTSQAMARFLDRFKSVSPDPPPVDPGVKMSSALYPYTREVQLANEGMGYGETVSDVMGHVENHQLVPSERWSRRTKSGRQRVDLKTLEPSAKEEPPRAKAYDPGRPTSK